MPSEPLTKGVGGDTRILTTNCRKLRRKSHIGRRFSTDRVSFGASHCAFPQGTSGPPDPLGLQLHLRRFAPESFLCGRVACRPGALSPAGSVGRHFHQPVTRPVRLQVGDVSIYLRFAVVRTRVALVGTDPMNGSDDNRGCVRLAVGITRPRRRHVHRISRLSRRWARTHHSLGVSSHLVVTRPGSDC